MSTPQHISEIMPAVMVEINRRVQAAEQCEHRPRVLDAIEDYQRRNKKQGRPHKPQRTLFETRLTTV